MIPRCINCGLRIMRAKRVTVSEIEENAQQLLREWVSPLVLSQEHELCMECVRLVTSSESGAPRQLGHDLVCFCCGFSVMRKRYYAVTSLRQDIRDIVVMWAGEHAINCLGKSLCRTCIQRAERLLLKKQTSRQVKEEEDEETEPTEKIEQNETTNVINPSFKKDRVSNKVIVSSMTLPNYQRIEAAAGCMFPHCGRDAARVPLTLRQQLLAEQALYVPTSARICGLHLDCHQPSELTADTLNTFTSDQICDLLFLVKKHRPIDFSDIENMNHYLKKIWLGVSWEEFKEILEKTPGLSKDDDPQLALAIHLTRRRTGENVEVLASMFQMSRCELEDKLLLAEKYLK